ncbi:MAG: hypothetical protein JRH20_25735, partial [Deltaproteobacteria bacterium]|nr:hypothetical protein [Deltaproteobacteria bacterium]
TSLEAFAQRLARFLGGEPSSATALQHTSDPDLALALPRVMFFALAAPGLPPLLHLLPRIIIIMGWLAAQRRQSGPLEPSARSALTLCSENLDLALWLAHLDGIPKFHDEPDSLPLPLSIVGDIKRLLSFIYQQNESDGLTLEAICERVGLDDRLTRITTLAALPSSLWRALRFTAPQGAKG